MNTFGKVLQVLAGLYGLLVIGVAAFVAVNTVTTDPDQGASLAGVWLLAVTFPLCLLTMVFLPDAGDAVLALIVLTLTGFVQAAAVWMLGRVLRRQSPTPDTTAPSAPSPRS
jgi:hypothetical protein